MAEGKVWLIGAGPGDPGLITVKGLEALERADVVVYDRLVSKEFLDYIAEGAEVVFVGRQPGLHEMTDEEISALLVHKARDGKAVVRLTGGDPFVFGPGPEEAAVLRAAGIPFEVVDGVTSAVAAPTYAGIPITYRDVASSFAVVNGDEDPASDTGLDWARLATGTDTIVLLEAIEQLDRVCAELVRLGRPATTPAAVVSWGTHARQETVVGTLADIAARAHRAGMHLPAVTVVGSVVTLRDRLRWYDDRPLFGMRALITRPRYQDGALRRLFEAEGAEVLELPPPDVVDTVSPEIVGRVMTVLADGQYGWVIFTSAASVDLFFRHLDASGHDTRAFGATKVCAIGIGTGELLRRHGIRADATVEESNLSEAVRSLAGRSFGRRRVLVPRADIARPNLVSELRRAGAEVEEVPLYTTSVPRQPNRESIGQLRRGEIDIVTFTGSNSVTNVLALLGEDRDGMQRATVACIGALAAQTARAAGLRVDITGDERDLRGLVAAVRERFAVAGTA